MNKGKHVLLSNPRVNYLPGFAALLFAAMVCAAFSIAGDDDFDLARQEIVLRDIGHQVLLHSGDSTSKVMPVKKVAENEYQIRFENEFAFQTDSLVQIVSRSLKKNNPVGSYIVNVLDCQAKVVIYGYAVSGNQKDNIVPCLGRNQPKNCYVIDIRFRSQGLLSTQKSFIIGGIPLLAFIGLIVSKSIRKRKDTIYQYDINDDEFKIGQTLFYPLKRQLVNGNLVTELTIKENKILLILANSPNAIIQRARLQKEIWEDEGVIVGRSLDVFISKLRKKLETDPSIQLVNIYGKGYRLETS